MKPVYLTDSQIATLRLALAEQCITTDPRSNKAVDLELLAEFRAIYKASAELLAVFDVITASPAAAVLLQYLTRLEAVGFTPFSVSLFLTDGRGRFSDPVAVATMAEAAREASKAPNALIEMRRTADEHAKLESFWLLTDSTATKPEEAIADFSSRGTAQGRLFALTIEGTARYLETLSPAF